MRIEALHDMMFLNIRAASFMIAVFTIREARIIIKQKILLRFNSVSNL